MCDVKGSVLAVGPANIQTYNGAGRIDMALQLPRRRFTVDEYHQMVKAGILAEDDRLELIDGEIVEMAPIGREHAGTVARLTELYVAVFREFTQVWPLNPIRLVGDAEAQPDVTLLRRRPDFYVSNLPTVAFPDRLLEANAMFG